MKNKRKHNTKQMKEANERLRKATKNAFLDVKIASDTISKAFSESTKVLNQFKEATELIKKTGAMSCSDLDTDSARKIILDHTIMPDSIMDSFTKSASEALDFNLGYKMDTIKDHQICYGYIRAKDPICGQKLGNKGLTNVPSMITCPECLKLLKTTKK